METLVVVGISLVLVSCLTLMSRPPASNDWRIGQVERKVDTLLTQLNVRYEDPTLTPIRELLSSGQKVEAVKVFRQLHPSVSLKEAIAVVDEIADQMS